MQDIHFQSLDLNLLRVFDAMTEELNVTRAGGRLGLSQSAVSHALRRLRQTLQDPLFVRGPVGMRPTPRAEEIAPRLRQGLAQLQEALSTAAFAPEATTRRFTIATGAYVCSILMPEAIALIHAEAPGADVRIHPITERLSEDLSSGRVDLAIGGFGRAASRFARESLFGDTAVWALRADHPAAAASGLTLETLAGLPQVLIATGDDRAVDGRTLEGGIERWAIWDGHGALDDVLAAQGRLRVIGLTVPDAASALAIVSRTDMVALVPDRVATALARQYDLRLFIPPYPSPPLQVEMLWRRNLGPAPALDWLKERLREAAARL
jgi:DNA-binding transcriptional LysR family regulator